MDNFSYKNELVSKDSRSLSHSKTKSIGNQPLQPQISNFSFNPFDKKRVKFSNQKSSNKHTSSVIDDDNINKSMKQITLMKFNSMGTSVDFQSMQVQEGVTKLIQSQLSSPFDSKNQNNILSPLRSSQTLIQITDKKQAIQQILKQLDGNEQQVKKSSSKKQSMPTKLTSIQPFHLEANHQDTSIAESEQEPIFKIQGNVFETFLRNQISEQVYEDNKNLDNLHVSESKSLLMSRLVDNKDIDKVAITTPSTPNQRYSLISYPKFDKNMTDHNEKSFNTNASNYQSLPKRFNTTLNNNTKITFQEAMNIMRIGKLDKKQAEKELKKVLQTKKQVKEPVKPVKPTPFEQMNEILKFMKQRDCYNNILKMKEEYNQLQKQSTLNNNARLSHCQLAHIRKIIPKEYYENTKDYERLNLNMLNDYLNKYSEKLSRAKANNPTEIKIDYGQFDDILCGIENQTFNPYHHHIDNEQEKKDDINEGHNKLKFAKPKYLNFYQGNDHERCNPISAKQQQEQENRSVKQQIREIKCKLIPDGSRTKKLYMKSADINNFSNYCHMIRNLKTRYGTSSVETRRKMKIFTPVNESLTKNSLQESVIIPAVAQVQAAKDLLQSSKFSTNNMIGIGASGQASTADYTRIMSPENTNFTVSRIMTSRGQSKDETASIQKRTVANNEQVDEKCNQLNRLIFNIVNTIGSIWKQTYKLKKENRGFQRIQQRKLRSLSQEMSQLNAFVNQSLKQSKQEYEKLRFEKNSQKLMV